MSRNVREALKNTAVYLGLAARAFMFWRRDPPVTTVSELAHFVDTRSKYVAQTTLFGYVKTRAGTKYVSLFEDEAFAESLRIANWHVYVACLCDMAIYGAARAGAASEADPTEIAALACTLIEQSLKRDDVSHLWTEEYETFRERFEKRANETVWRQAAIREESFGASPAALVEWAPIADELKKLDVVIVKNSMRFKWKRVRDDLDELIDTDAILDDWKSIASGRDPSVTNDTAEAG